ncbi:MAG: hypothetical protein EBR82_28515 [Caulobacteraceae bacterium]|nr:hypothetical protein [Caulobacteraceae bacterium]
MSEPSGFTLFPVHNPETTTPGLPVKAATILYCGCMAAWDPANARCEAADPTIAATSIVLGVMQETVDNSAGILGALKARPQSGIFRLKNDGNLTSAHLFKRVRVVDDHTVGVPAGTDADRFAGLLLGLEGTGFVWVLIAPGVTHDRAPVTVTLTSTNGTAGAAADLAALKAETEKTGDDLRAIHAALVTHGLIAPAA